MNFITTADAPPAGGHYSQAVAANGFLFVAGQLPIRLEGGIPDGIEAQTRQALANAEAILKAAGSGLDKVVSATVYVSNIELWPDVNRVYAEIFGTHRPARTVAVSPQLHYGALVEVQVIALA
ncbi:RidA family protein [Enterovirga sp. CN4-39]|uniref:RidA family protein n=1 Tax=Enterovirga sp. CN4-39 TaxID=3400910 RepID=UPI003C05B38A